MWRKILKHRIVSAVFGAAFLLVMSGWLWVYVALRGISQPLIIHFNNVSGITQTGTMRNITNIGILAVLILIVDFVIAIELEDRSRFLGKFLAVGAAFLAILIFIGFAAIIGVN